MSAKTAALARTHAPIGSKTNGRNWIEADRPGGTGQLPAYIQNVRNAIMRGGVPESRATAIAIGRVRDWANGKGRVGPEVRVAARKAIAEWDAMRARAKARRVSEAARVGYRLASVRRLPGESLGAWGKRLKAADRAKNVDFERQHPRGRDGRWVLGSGSQGSGVRRVQRRLGVTVDGRYGPVTEAAVRRFQRAHRLLVDGVVGAQTLAAIRGRRRVKPGALTRADREWLSGVRRRGVRARARSGRRVPGGGVLIEAQLRAGGLRGRQRRDRKGRYADVPGIGNDALHLPSAPTISAPGFVSRWRSRGYQAATTEDRRAHQIPPAGRDAMVAADKAARVQAVWRDAKGREQRRYSAAHVEQQARAKFARVSILASRIRGAHRDLLAAARDGDDDAAAVVLIHEFGLRPGSEKDTGAAVKAFGATNLRVEHVRLDGDQVRLRMTGKKGVELDLAREAPDVAGLLRRRLAGKRPGDRVFATDETRARRALQDRLPGFKLKDLRTLRGTTEAARMVDGMPVPRGARELASARRRVGEHVAAILGNTPTVALASYIDPRVFEAWQTASKSVDSRAARR